ncbi:MAG: 3-oxoacyl-ACP reductase family protein [Bacteroidota bacterium]
MEAHQKIALVTGGTRGIGRAITIELAQQGYRVIFTYFSKSELAESLVQEIAEKHLPTALALKCDMSDSKAVEALLKDIKKQYPKIDVVVNNAGILGHSRPFLFTTDDEWWKVVKTNVASVVNTCRYVLPMMIKQKRGNIINITSLSGQKGNPGQSAYSASKAAIVSFSKALTKEVARSGIIINCVSPGLIETDMTSNLNNVYFQERMSKSPLKRMGTSLEVANLVGYLANSAPPYIVGQEITIDGGIGV